MIYDMVYQNDLIIKINNISDIYNGRCSDPPPAGESTECSVVQRRTSAPDVCSNSLLTLLCKNAPVTQQQSGAFKQTNKQTNGQRDRLTEVSSTANSR
ncbi:hypothetical protein F2P81_017539 [Scophthalmus maximus]|uniref:Uncharacterized protein n=1 Tax=Scophthalmus maximus TaxID=52904 RepID=A0A6A4SF04_SCOMX|nr:hypothetical protein F2P81_017539 [Scophthalmus maximus]